MKITALFGTRPETIKLAPFIKLGRELGHDVKVVFTGQHREMALPILNFFGIIPDHDLNLMRANQSLSSLSSLLLNALDELPGIKDTDAFIVQGDTTSAFVGGYWAFLNKIPVVHLEAGLRTHDIRTPFPEEANRQLLSRISHLHLAPTDEALKSLAQEGIYKNAFNIGNTGLDALRIVSEKLTTDDLRDDLKKFVEDKKLVLITSHRRENFGEGMQNIADAIKVMTAELPEVRFIFPVHLNPNVQSVMSKQLAHIANLKMIEPMDYLSFVSVMKRASVILTDSGGIQEEAPTLKIPVVVMRESTERPEGVEKGFATLVGTNPTRIYDSVKKALRQGHVGQGENPYGDGLSSQKAWNILTQSGVIL